MVAFPSLLFGGCLASRRAELEGYMCVFSAGNDPGHIACWSQNKDHSGFSAPRAPCLPWTEVQENGKGGDCEGYNSSAAFRSRRGGWPVLQAQPKGSGEH